MELIKNFEENTEGRDFVVGDIHGCLQELHWELERLEFDKTKDRLFSVGDLVDRGSDSLGCLKLLDEPWFHAVKGNHEDMMIMFLDGELGPDSYIHNGGQWAWDIMTDQDNQSVAQEFMRLSLLVEKLPLGMTVLRDGKKYGIVHADVPGYDWDEFVSDLETVTNFWERSGIINATMWDRSRIAYGYTENVKGLERLYVGHSYVKVPTDLGNVRFIDTGCVFGHDLTVLEIGK